MEAFAAVVWRTLPAAGVADRPIGGGKEFEAREAAIALCCLLVCGVEMSGWLCGKVPWGGLQMWFRGRK